MEMCGRKAEMGASDRDVREPRVAISQFPGAEESMPTTTNKPKVLVADDEPVIADTLAMILNQSGFDARAVYVIMADLNGIDAAIRIRALLPGIKILLFSGQAATADLLEKARNEGYEFDILAKPVHPQDLLARLRK